MSQSLHSRRMLVAASRLLARKPDPEFANDAPSVIIAGCERGDAKALAFLQETAMQDQVDVIAIESDPARSAEAVTAVHVLARRGACLLRWLDCDLWASAGGAALLIMPRGVDACFAYDGLALVSLRTRPTRSIGAGAARARRQLLRTAAALDEDDVEASLMRRAA